MYNNMYYRADTVRVWAGLMMLSVQFCWGGALLLFFKKQAAHMLAERWGTELLVPIEKCTTMACVRCPHELLGWVSE